MLRSAERHYRTQQRILARAIKAVRRAFQLGDASRAYPALVLAQRDAARDAATSVQAMLDEQRIHRTARATVNADALAGLTSNGRPLLRLIVDTEDLPGLEHVTLTQIADAARAGAGFAITATPNVGWTRMVNPPCCKRCAVQAGKFFKFNDGFLRHPNCDCRHIPTMENVAGDVATSPQMLFDNGHVHGLTLAEQRAITDGADFTRVVNAARELWLDSPAHPSVRRIYEQAGENQNEAVRLLRRAGYLV